MKIPKYIDELIDKRTEYADKLEEVSTKLDNWLDKNNILCDPNYVNGGCMIYVESSTAGECVRRDIENFNREE